MQVDRNAYQADDLARLVVQRALVGQAPAGLAAAVQVQLQLVVQHQPFLEYAAVLLGVAGAKLCREDFSAGLAEQWLQALEAATLDQGVVGQHVAGGRVFDEDGGVGDDVEDRQ